MGFSGIEEGKPRIYQGAWGLRGLGFSICCCSTTFASPPKPPETHVPSPSSGVLGVSMACRDSKPRRRRKLAAFESWLGPKRRRRPPPFQRPCLRSPLRADGAKRRVDVGVASDQGRGVSETRPVVAPEFP